MDSSLFLHHYIGKDAYCVDNLHPLHLVVVDLERIIVGVGSLCSRHLVGGLALAPFLVHDVELAHDHDVDHALVVAVVVPHDGEVLVVGHGAVVHEEMAAHGELALADEDHEVPHYGGGGLHDGCWSGVIPHVHGNDGDVKNLTYLNDVRAGCPSSQ